MAVLKKGIILAGGSGSRLYPLTSITSKQLLPLFDKPLIFYPLTTLILGGLSELALVSTSRDIPQFRKLLGDGSDLGISIEYFVQDEPKGIADAFLVCEEFIDNNNVALILGDNVFHGNLRLLESFSTFKKGAKVFGYPVSNPKRYGVLEIDKRGKVLDIIEKPHTPPSNFAVPGLYLYDSNVVSFTKELQPSKRGELEITDLNKKYLQEGDLDVDLWGRGIAWLDVGTENAMAEAINYIHGFEKRQSFKIGCPEEAAYRSGFIDIKQLNKLIDKMPDCNYKNYLMQIVKEELVAYDQI